MWKAEGNRASPRRHSTQHITAMELVACKVNMMLVMKMMMMVLVCALAV